VEWHPLWLSFQVAALATLVTGAVGIALAAVLALKRFPGRDLLDVLVTAPMILPPTVLGYYLLAALGRSSAVGRAYESVFGSSIVFTRTGIVVAAAIGSLPFVVKSARAALEGVDRTLVRAARTLGATPMRAFFTVQLPLASAGIGAGLMLGFARALGDFGATLMVGGNIPGTTRTASLGVYDAIQANDEAKAAGMIAVFSAVAVFTLYAANRLTRTRHGD
jgi:molybdate transport system permease protein